MSCLRAAASSRSAADCASLRDPTAVAVPSPPPIWAVPAPCPRPGDPHAQPYRRRRPETTFLYRIVQEHLETYLALAHEADPMGDGVPGFVEDELRSYLKCGFLAHGFARARCSRCG